MHKAIMERYKEKNPLIIYSMWSGYLQESAAQDFVKDFRMEKLHTSGHADREAINMLISKTSPRQIVPIHTESPEEFRKICNPGTVLLVNDKEVISL